MYQVMLVDDEKMIINSLALGFPWKSMGFEIVATATSSAEALKMIEFIRPNLVFTDIKMPGLTGMELMERVHQTLPQILFVVISGYADFAYAQKAMQIGALAYCLKPLENEDIAAALDKARRELSHSTEIIQSAFAKLSREPNLGNSEAFLSKMFLQNDRQGSVCVAVCVGDAEPLLAGNVCYNAIVVGSGCNLYVIASNAEYVEKYSFQTALLKAAAEKKILSFVYMVVKDGAAALSSFLCDSLPGLMDAAYSYFICENTRTLGRAVADNGIKSEALLERLSAGANKNRITEVLEILGGLTEEEKNAIRPCDAVQIYNLCKSLIARLQNQPAETDVLYCSELAVRYKNFDEMLSRLCERLASKKGGGVDFDKIRNETFKEILRFVNVSFTTEITFQQICADFSINPSYLSQLFKKEIGVTFTSYLSNLRITYAKELLENTNILMSEISDKVGYDYFYFTKLFKKETGLTPKQYRAEHRRT